MSFEALYDAVQAVQGKISTKWLTSKAIELTDFKKIKEQWSGVIDPKFIQGFFIEGPLGPPVPLNDNEGLIVLSRGYDPHRRRFVYTKELMHVFDTPDEKADTPEKFDAQAEKFADPDAAASAQYKAEAKAFWRALAVLCQEQRRLDFKSQLENNQISLVLVATSLQIPPAFARHLFRNDFLNIVKNIKMK